MTQETLLEIIKDNPGIEQRELMKRNDLNHSNTSKMLAALRKYGLVQRISFRGSFKLYPVEAAT